MSLRKNTGSRFGKSKDENPAAAQKPVDINDPKPQLEKIVIQDPGDWGDSLFWKSPEYHFNANYTLIISSHNAYCVFNSHIVDCYQEKGTYDILPEKYLDRFASPDTESLSFCVYFARNDFRLTIPWHKEIVTCGIRSVIGLSLDGELTFRCQYPEEVLNLALRSNLSIEEAINQLLHEYSIAFPNKCYDHPISGSLEDEEPRKNLEKKICEAVNDSHNVFRAVECKVTVINKQFEQLYTCPYCKAPLESFNGTIGYCPNDRRWVSPRERDRAEMLEKREPEEAAGLRKWKIVEQAEMEERIREKMEAARLQQLKARRAWFSPIMNIASVFSVTPFLSLLSRLRKKDVGRTIDKISNVQFSAFSNSVVNRKHYYALRILMYEECMKSEVERLRNAFPGLDRETKTAAPISVRNSQQVTVRLVSSDVVIGEPEMTLPWEGMIREFSFSYYVPGENKKDSVLITAGIYIDHVLATRLQIISDVEGEKSHLIVRRMDIQAAFMSYSSKDRHNVFKIAQGMHKARPDLDLFMDVESLRSGDDWKSVIENKICESDVLFLCWSRSAKESKWVDYEWRFAYHKKGAEFIEPIPLEPSQLCQPPEELNGKHFNDVDLLLSYADKMLDGIGQSE